MHGSACGGVCVAFSGRRSVTVQAQVLAVRSHKDVVRLVCASVPALFRLPFGVRLGFSILLRFPVSLPFFFMNLGVNNGSSTLQ